MELKDLVGKHKLYGVDLNSESIKEQWGDSFEDCEVINFDLDGQVYTAIENPDDGYRSSMREIKESTAPISNRFAGQEVLAFMRPDTDSNDILDLIDTTTGRIVLSVGTEDTDDYYPMWVAVFTPENMAINAGKA